MTLSAQMVADVAVFLNTDEHAETLTIDGKSVVGIRENRLDAVPINQFGGAKYTQDITRLYVAVADWPAGLATPAPNRTYTVNGKRLTIDTASEQAGLWILDFQTGNN